MNRQNIYGVTKDIDFYLDKKLETENQLDALKVILNECRNKIKSNNEDRKLGSIDSITHSLRGKSLIEEWLEPTKEIKKLEERLKVLNESIQQIESINNDRYKNIHNLIEKLPKDNNDNQVFIWQVGIILMTNPPLTDKEMENMELLIKNWKVENAIGLATLLRYEDMSLEIYSKEDLETSFGRSLDFLEPNKYYEVMKDLLNLKLIKEHFRELSNEELMKKLAHHLDPKTFRDMDPATLAMLKEADSNEKE